jgi:cysteine desulfurase
MFPRGGPVLHHRAPSMSPPINLDHNATTLPRPEVVEEVARVMRDAGGNPGSRHALGRRARQVLESSRERIAQVLGADREEVVFTSGGTESINMALRGLLPASTGEVIASPPGEHPATEETLGHLAAQGWRRIELSLDWHGRLRNELLPQLPWEDLRLVTLLLAHNETGVVQDVSSLADICLRHPVPWHVDAVQAVGKIDVDFHALGATALSLAAHKFHGPRGIGALLVQRGAAVAPLLRGGHQERGLRPGTECTALAAGMALALELWHVDRQRLTAHVTALREQLQRGLQAACPPVVVLGHPEHRLPNTLNVAFPGCDGEALLVALDLAGTCCSTGSTCASGSTEPPPVHGAMGVPPDVSRSSLRFSLGRDNTSAEIADAVERIDAIVRRLREVRTTPHENSANHR